MEDIFYLLFKLTRSRSVTWNKTLPNFLKTVLRMCTKKISETNQCSNKREYVLGNFYLKMRYVVHGMSSDACNDFDVLYNLCEIAF